MDYKELIELGSDFVLYRLCPSPPGNLRGRQCSQPASVRLRVLVRHSHLYGGIGEGDCKFGPRESISNEATPRTSRQWAVVSKDLEVPGETVEQRSGVGRLQRCPSLRRPERYIVPWSFPLNSD